jgi:hypothetical protein
LWKEHPHSSEIQSGCVAPRGRFDCQTISLPASISARLLSSDRHWAQERCFALNSRHPDEEDGRRWLVAAFGSVGWVYNARAAGKVTLTRNGKSETLAVREASAQEAVSVLRKYMEHVAVTRPYFDVKVDSPDEAYLAEAPKHPVFELLPL